MPRGAQLGREAAVNVSGPPAAELGGAFRPGGRLLRGVSSPRSLELSRAKASAADLQSLNHSARDTAVVNDAVVEIEAPPAHPSRQERVMSGWEVIEIRARDGILGGLCSLETRHSDALVTVLSSFKDFSSSSTFRPESELLTSCFQGRLFPSTSSGRDSGKGSCSSRPEDVTHICQQSPPQPQQNIREGTPPHFTEQTNSSDCN